jgi:hypothetical protein
MTDRKCHFCGTTEKELRPYGPGGSDVCFPCATETPAREAAAQAAFGSLLDATEAVSQGPVMIGTDEGPIPFDPRRIGEATP